MDTNQYIASGILELYVLDLLDNPAERLEVERYADEYPEIRAEILGIEIALEAYAEANAKPLNGALLLPVLASLKNRESSLPDNTGDRAPLTETEKEVRQVKASWVPWAIAAIAGLLALFLYLNNQASVDALETEQSELGEELAALREDCDATSAALAASQARNRVLSNPATSNVILQGSDNAPASRAIVFHNVELDETLFSATNLPTPPTGRQYQLWALDGEGTPVSIAVLDADLTVDTLVDVDFLESAATFAITLEEAGGKPTPDLSQLQVIGSI